MLYLIYGTDTHKARKKLHELLDLAQKKRPGAELFKITSENWDEAQFDELLVSQGLFEKKYTVVLDNLFEKQQTKEYILDKLVDLAQSEQVFLVLEGKVDAPSLKKIEKNSKQVQEFVKKDNKKEPFNIFSITTGLQNKDKKTLWVSYRSFLEKGTAPEEIHGIFFWQVKNMILSGTRNYKQEELLEMSSSLVDMTHRVRQGEGELEIMLEKWILER